MNRYGKPGKQGDVVGRKAHFKGGIVTRVEMGHSEQFKKARKADKVNNRN